MGRLDEIVTTLSDLFDEYNNVDEKKKQLDKDEIGALVEKEVNIDNFQVRDFRQHRERIHSIGHSSECVQYFLCLNILILGLTGETHDGDYHTGVQADGQEQRSRAQTQRIRWRCDSAGNCVLPQG